MILNTIICNLKVSDPNAKSDGDSTSDSPSEWNLSNGFKQVSASDSFTMWLMYNPGGTDSIWVPLRLTNWSWSGTATRSGSIWELTGSSNTANPSSSATTTFPEWTGNVSGLGFVNE